VEKEIAVRGRLAPPRGDALTTLNRCSVRFRPSAGCATPTSARECFPAFGGLGGNLWWLKKSLMQQAPCVPLRYALPWRPPIRAFTVSACGPPSISVTSEKHFTGSSFRFATHYPGQLSGPKAQISRGGVSKGEGSRPLPFESLGSVGASRNAPTFLKGAWGRCLCAKDISPIGLWRNKRKVLTSLQTQTHTPCR